MLANPSPHATRAARARRGSVEDDPSHPVGIAMSWNLYREREIERERVTSMI